MKTTIKLQDTDSTIGAGSRLENFWKNNGFENYYTKFRNIKLPSSFQTLDSLDKLVNKYSLNAVGFGNWLTQEDRFNYICALTIGLYDLNKVVRFDNNIGLNSRVSFSFGARGKGGALAHFEPHTFIINVTRYKNGPYEKEDMFLRTGGAGSVAHEYGHALDYFAGIFIDKTGSLSQGNSVNTTLPDKGTIHSKNMTNLLNAIIWSDMGRKLKSNYYQRLEQSFGGDYIFRRNEIFARAFEKFVQYKLAKMGIKNKFLSETKYVGNAYLKDSEIERLEPLFNKLIDDIRKHV